MPGKGPKAEQLSKMVAKAQAQITSMQANIDGGLLTEEEAAEAIQTIEDMTNKIARLSAPR